MTTYQELIAQKNCSTSKSTRPASWSPKRLWHRCRNWSGSLASRHSRSSLEARWQEERPAKYQDPESGKTWTGRGKPPNWILGKDRTLFEIK